MSHDIEVEVRGPLSHEQREKLVTLFRKDGTLSGIKNRTLIDYSSCMPGDTLAGRTRDIRLRVTNKIPEIIVKIGEWKHADQRQELSIKGQPGEFDTMVKIFAAMGYTKGVLCVRRTEVYLYKGVEFAFVEVPGHSWHFEAEKMHDAIHDAHEARVEIEQLCRKLGLTLFDEKDFFNYVKKLNAEANELFDFERDYTEGYFQKRFNL